MSIKKNFFYFFYFLFTFIIFIFISYFYLDFFDINRHWSSQFDQELTFAYNALLFNSGIKHEFIDHSAYFTILFLSIFIRVAELLNFIDFYNLRTFVEKDNLDVSLQQIIPLVRIYGGIALASWAVIINLLFYQTSQSKIFSFLLTLVIFSMPGTIEHAWQLRTELMSSLFMILSLLMIVNYFKNENSKYQVEKLFLFFIFLYSAILNKSQVFFYVPFLFLYSTFYFNKITQLKLDFLKELSEKKYLYFFYSLIIVYVVLKLILFKGSILSLIFILFNILGLNIVFFYFAKKSDLNPLTLINHLNLILILSFILFKGILFIHPSTNEMAFNNTFTDIMGVLKYSILSEENINQSTILSKLNLIIINLLASIKKYFSTINVYSILFFLVVISNFLFKKKIGNKIFFLNFISISIPILFTFIASFRNLANYYNVFWDFFFLLPFCNFINRINLKFSAVMILVLIGLIPLNYKYVINTKENILANNKILLCKKFNFNEKNNYLVAFHKQIPKQKFIELCSK